MKVKITYTVDLAEVPEKADPLLKEAAAATKEISKRVASLGELKSESIEKCLKEIADIRSILMNVDFALDDCDSMLMGYLRALTDGPSYPELPNEEG